MDITGAKADRTSRVEYRQGLAADGRNQSVLLMEDTEAVSGPPSLLGTLSEAERAKVSRAGRRRVIYAGKMLFQQGAAHDGIYLIETGRIRVFYTAPSGREITLAYWYPGNFVGGPEIFGAGVHLWSGVATDSSSVLHFAGDVLRRLVTEIPSLAIGLIEGLTFKGKCYSGLAQMLGTRSITERLDHLLLHLVDLYGVETPDGILINCDFSHAEIAHLIGATRQWVTISLKRLKERDIIATKHSKILVRRPDLLRN